MALTAKQQRFVDEYLIDLNATQAAIRAGYSPNNADVTGPRLLGNVGVAAEITKGQQERVARVHTDQDYVLANLTEVVERTMQRSPVLEFDRDLKQMVQSKDEDGNNIWQFDARGAVSALQLVGKHHGMFVDRSEVKHGGKVEVRVRIVAEGRKITSG